MHSIIILITVVSSFGLCAMDDQGDRKTLVAAVADHTVRNPGLMTAGMSVKNKLANSPGIDKNLVRALCVIRSLPEDAQGMVFENIHAYGCVNSFIDKAPIDEHLDIKLVSDELLACKSGNSIKIIKVADGSCVQNTQRPQR